MSDDGKDGQAGKKGGKGKRLLLILVALLFVIGGSAAAWFMGLVPIGTPPAEAATDGAAAVPDTIELQEIVFVDLPDLLVNLDLNGRRPRFLKLATALEVSGQQNADVVRRFVPRIIDNFHSYLRAIQVEELAGAEAVYRVKRDLLTRVNQVVRPIPVRDVLVKEMLVQ